MALNLIAPGLGLLRIGAWRAAITLMLLPAALLLAITLVLTERPTPTPAGFAWIVASLMLVTLAIVTVSMAATWLRSTVRPPRAAWWSRWPALLTAALLTQIVALVGSDAIRQLYRPFDLPSDSMAPTLVAGEKIVGDMRDHRARVGSIVMVTMPNGIYVKRVAAVGGQRIAMRDGWPIVDGTEAAHHVLRRTPAGTMFVERLPGEAGSHVVIDAGHSPMDDRPEIVIPEGHVFLLGDDRDRSADSRLPVAMFGTGFAPLDSVIGRPLFVYWSAERSRIGHRL